MSVYHWNIILRFAYFSTITHLAALTCLRTYFFQHPAKCIVRAFLMAGLALMLLILGSFVHPPLFISGRGGKISGFR